jgi:mRNA export factor
MSKDIELTPAPTDSVSSLSWSPVADFISVSCWDNTTKVYQVMGNGSSQGKAQIQHDQPALCSAWSKVIYKL